MREENQKKINPGKRKFIKKAAITSAFVIPTIMTFAVKDLYACSSGTNLGDGAKKGGAWGGNNEGNGDGNDKGGLW